MNSDINIADGEQIVIELAVMLISCRRPANPSRQRRSDINLFQCHSSALASVQHSVR
jgi:hypothetical protein